MRTAEEGSIHEAYLENEGETDGGLQYRPPEKRGFSLKRLADAYFDSKPFEEDGKFYERLGVKYVKNAIMGTFGRLVDTHGRTSNYFIGDGFDLDSLKKFDGYTKLNEAIHIGGLALCAMNMPSDMARGDYGSLAFMGFLALANTGAIMLQRYNRAKIRKVMRRRHGEKAEDPPEAPNT